jgi:hypothetical protein
MNFLSGTDALIVDLRRNSGGDPAMVRLISSYLFGPEKVHLNSIYSRPDDQTTEYWTLDSIRGMRYGRDRPVYVLTSARTFSGGEEFGYNLQALRRATIVGEKTGGGAHPGRMERLGDHFSMFVPVGRAINPITSTNWEVVGVIPDVATDEASALAAAHRAALAALLAKTADQDQRALLQDALRELDDAETLPTGKWTGSSTPAGEPELALTFDVSSSVGTLRITAHSPDRGSYDFHHVKLNNGTLTFSFESGPVVLCSLRRRADGAYEGRCVAADGTSAPMLMIPPRTER